MVTTGVLRVEHSTLEVWSVILMGLTGIDAVIVVKTVPAVGEPGDPGVLFLSLAGELALVLSPDLLREFWREGPVPI